MTWNKETAFFLIKIFIWGGSKKHFKVSIWMAPCKKTELNLKDSDLN